MDESENPNMETTNPIDDSELQKLEEKARKAEESLAAEEKLRKELEGLNSKLLAEKTALLDSLAGEKGSLQEYQEKAAKLQAQKNDLDNQLRVSIYINFDENFSIETIYEYSETKFVLWWSEMKMKFD